MRPKTLTLLTLIVASAGAAAVTAADGPLTVSPGSTGGETTISERCPTFSWSEAAGAESYELAVYRLSESEMSEDAAEVWRVGLPGGSHTWTPSLERCLEFEGRYAWSVRALSESGAEEWSQPALFSVTSGPSVAELENWLSRLRKETVVGEALPVPGTDEAAVLGMPTRTTNLGGNHFFGTLSVDGDACIGEECIDGEGSFLNTIRIDSDNPGIDFNDASTTPGFPTNDWAIRIGDSSNGGEAYFRIEDTTAGTVPFRIDPGAVDDSVRISDGGIDFRGDLRAPDGELTAGGVKLASSGEWKRDFEPVDSHEVLAKLSSIAIQTWVFKNDPDVRHIGPISEEFHAAFDLSGHDPRHLSVTDVNGVTLAAIQGLAERAREQDERLARQRDEIEELRVLNGQLREVLDELLEQGSATGFGR